MQLACRVVTCRVQSDSGDETPAGAVALHPSQPTPLRTGRRALMQAGQRQGI